MSQDTTNSPETTSVDDSEPRTVATVPETLASPTVVTDDRHSSRKGRWIDHWDPEDATLWRDGGCRIARRNLSLSVFAEFLGFAVWALWSIVVPQLGNAGFTLTLDQQFWLIAVPSLVGATLRLPYTFAVPLLGGRNWTIISALLLLLPTLSLAYIVTQPQTPFAVLVGVAALAGVGGGNFASSMANISFFYPEKEKGKALGLNAAGGNLGTAAVQFVVPVVITIGAGISLERAGLVFIPFIVLAAFLAWRSMDNLSSAKADYRAFGAAVKNPHTWIISFLYIGTFGSFIGYSGAFPTLLKSQFPEMTMSIAFLGALVGSLARPFGGIISDRLGGARVTIVSFLVMALGAFGAIMALRSHSFALFMTSFLILFLATGVGNGATYRMIPAVFRASAKDAANPPVARKAAAGCIGIAGAIGAFGGFGIPRGFAASNQLSGTLAPALWIFIGAYLVMCATTWAVYQRRGASMAAAAI